MSVRYCPHCGSPFTASEMETAPLRCAVCGAPLDADRAALAARQAVETSDVLPIREAVVREEDDSATRAVAQEQIAPVVAQARAERLAEQPTAAVAPPADERTQALPTSALPTGAGARRETTQELPASAAPIPTAPAPPLAPQEAGGAARTISIVLIALLLLAIVVVAALFANGVIGGATTSAPLATATSAAPTLTATPSLTIYSVPGFYQIGHPSGWLIQQRNAAPQSYWSLLTAPVGGASVNIEAQQASGAPALATLDQQFLDALTQPGTTPTPAGAAASVSLAGQTWIQLTSDLTLRVASGQPAQYAHVVALSAQRGGYVYTIVYLAPSASAAAAGPAFTAANRAYFQPMLASFGFLG